MLRSQKFLQRLELERLELESDIYLWIYNPYAKRRDVHNFMIALDKKQLNWEPEISVVSVH